MLKIIKNKNFDFKTIMPIYKNGNYRDFVKKQFSLTEDILLCPTDAIDIEQGQIDNKKCIDCLLCPYFLPTEIIEFSDKDSFKRFSDFVNSDKKYLTKWIGQIVTASNNQIKCGYEIKIDSGSRTKRIPLLLLFEEKTSILKVVDSFKDVEYGIINLEEIENAIIQNNFLMPTKIIVVNQMKNNYSEKLQDTVKKLREKHSFELIFIEDIWDVAKNGISTRTVEWKKIFFMM